MSKRSHSSHAPATASEDLVERLKSAGNDVHLVRDLVEANDSATVASAIVALLTSRSSDAVNDAKRRKKTRNRRTPNETFLEILLFADRDTLDTMQLVGRFLFEMIRDREDTELPLRSISRMNTGKCFRSWIDRSSWERHWRPMVENGRGLNTGKRFYPATIKQLLPYLRLACCCESVCIDLQWTAAVNTKHRGAAYRALFGELVVPSMFVNVLTVCIDSRSAAEALRQLRAFEAFKAMSKLVVKMEYFHQPAAFKDPFLVYAAKCGARSIEFDSGPHPPLEMVLWRAPAFGLAEPTTGGDRSISGVDYKLGGEHFLRLLIHRVAELDGTRHVDISFKLSNVSSQIDSTGFEKYQKGDGRTWLVDDLENHVMAEIKQTENAVEVHVFSSV